WAPSASSAASVRRSARPSYTWAWTWGTWSPSRAFPKRCGWRCRKTVRQLPLWPNTSVGRAMERIPILQLQQFLLVTIQVELHDQLAITLQDDLTEKLSKSRAKGVLIDISALDIVDSFIGRTLSHIASMARIMDAATVLVGMRPAVAITLVELGMS